jgi:hypothetical protein
MAQICERAPSGHGAQSKTSFLSGDNFDHSQSPTAAQGRRELIRDALADNFEFVVMFGEMALVALDHENDRHVERMFNQLVKTVLGCAENIKELIEAREAGA